MCRGSKRKCFHCKTKFRPDHRNRDRQRYCSEPDCQKASKAASQKRWLKKPENRDHFKSEVHVRRVQEWRKRNPGYWRKQGALQDSLNGQHAENKEENSNKTSSELQNSLALQDSLSSQSPLIIGLLANLTGHTLQDDIARSVSHFIQSGLDILSEQQKANGGQHANQTDHPP
jgi:hypothetical protein